MIKKSVSCGPATKNFRPGPGPNPDQKNILVPVPSGPRSKKLRSRSHPSLSQKKTSVRIPEPKFSCRIWDRQHFPALYLNFFYGSLELEKLCKTLSSFWNVFIENLIKRILLTMKVYSNPMIRKQTNQIWAYFCTLQFLYFNDENLSFSFPFIVKLLRKQ